MSTIDSKAIVILEVESEKHEIQIEKKSNVEIYWIHRNQSRKGDSVLIQNQLSKMVFPNGDYFAWVSAEKNCATNVREFLIYTKDANIDWIKCTGYWSRKL